MAKGYIEQRDGGYYLAATRVSPDSIVYAFRRGESPETICQNFELLDLEEVYGAIAYYLGNQVMIDAYLARQSDKWVEGKRQADPLPANLRERLFQLVKLSDGRPVLLTVSGAAGWFRTATVRERYQVSVNHPTAWSGCPSDPPRLF